MFKYWLVRFPRTGTTAVMRTVYVGTPRSPQLLDPATGAWATVRSLPEHTSEALSSDLDEILFPTPTPSADQAHADAVARLQHRLSKAHPFSR